MSPGDLGQALKPFVFLDIFDAQGPSAGGPAILGAMPKEEAQRVLEINRAEIERRYPRMTADMAGRLLEETREQGYSVVPCILAPGFWGIGMPVLQPDGQPVAAIVLIASTVRLGCARLATIAAKLQRLSCDRMFKPSEG